MNVINIKKEKILKKISINLFELKRKYFDLIIQNYYE